MFDSIIFRQRGGIAPEPPLDLELLFETLLFYDSVTVVTNKAVLEQIIKVCGHGCVLDLVSNNFIKFEYSQNLEAIATENLGADLEVHSPVFIGGAMLNLEQVASELFQESTGKSGRGRRLANQFVKNVKKTELSNDVLKNLMLDLADSVYVEKSIQRILQDYAPEYPNINEVTFRVSNRNESLFVNTNINFYLLNMIYNKKIPASHSSMSVAYLLSYLLGVRSELHTASLHSAEIATDSTRSAIMGFKAVDLLASRSFSSQKLDSFQKSLDVEIKNVSGALLKGERSFSEYLKLLEKSKKMRSWLAQKEPDADLIKEYYEALAADSWLDKMAPKTARWGIFTAAGIGLDLLGSGGFVTAAGIGLSAVDAFLIDKLAKGWRPNHFITDVKNFYN